MRTFHHILFPVDFSERCQASGPLVASWAKQFDAQVTLLHTVHIPIRAYGGADGYPIIIDFPGIEAEAKARLESFAIEAPRVSRVVNMGDPAHEIVQYAEKNDVDLIMMPTHGYGKFRSLLVGSTAAKVLHDAHCPVWTSAHTENLPAEGRNNIHNILCAIEITEDNAELIRFASELAGAWQATLRLVHAVPAAETRPEKYLETDFRAALIKMSREAIAVLQQQAGTSLEVTIEGGRVSHVVRDAVLEYHADLVVTGQGKIHKTLGQLRSNEYAIVRDSPAPVLNL